MNAVVYDLEIAKCIPDGNNHDESLLFAKSWGDYEGLGISVIGMYDFAGDTLSAFFESDFPNFYERAKNADVVIGFNSRNFDDKILKAHDMPLETTYDLFEEVKVASGQSRRGVARKGYGLDSLAVANNLAAKRFGGALAPVMFQRGKLKELEDYCLGDVAVTRDLFLSRANLIDPTNGRVLKLAEPTFKETW